MFKRILSILIFVVIIAAGFIHKDILLEIIREGGILSVLISMLFVAICVFFPVIPFPILAGIIGAVFGTSQGIIISLIGAMTGTTMLFFLSRFGFQDLAQGKLMNHEKVKEFELFLERHAFIAIMISRLIPIIPATVVNVICGLSRVNGVTFIIASALGKLPNIMISSYAGAQFNNNKLFSFGLYGIYLLIILFINLFMFYRKRKIRN